MPGSILEKLADLARVRVDAAIARVPLETVRREAEELARLSPAGRFSAALRKPGLSLICELKKASPSRGLISPDFAYEKIAEEYESGGADALSVLTEPEYFLGRDEYLTAVSQRVALPLLRKDFTVSEYQIYEAKTLGASAGLLICAITQSPALRDYIEIARSVGLDALVETRTEDEIDTALAAGAQIIGVNNRDLRDFSENLSRAVTLRKYVPADRVFVAESGIKSGRDTLPLIEAGIDAALVGEAAMLARDKAAFLRELKGGLNG
ncbi:MAG: indole-3-glycerol phosphate synthase TrpC [Oscillospiraceae bacterium]|nr:indole-3-glycerol phosphate synthase TrpC [Oscillospiraceae bacterium]